MIAMMRPLFIITTQCVDYLLDLQLIFASTLFLLALHFCLQVGKSARSIEVQPTMKESSLLWKIAAVAEQSARAAGAVHRHAAGRPIEVVQYTHRDTKLKVDQDAEAVALAIIEKAFPEHSILSEEAGDAVLGSTEWNWIVDPLDGTVNFSRGLPHYCSSVGVRYGDEFVVGVIYDAVRDELFSAVAGAGAWLNGMPIRVSQTGHLRDAILTAGVLKNEAMIPAGAAWLQEVLMTARKVRMTGSAALDLAYVACGRFDAYIDAGVQLWDLAAGVVILREAGGRIDMEGVDHGIRFSATNGLIELPALPW
jgi:myo-inositol-1(or 4)-monophosphatase